MLLNAAIVFLVLINLGLSRGDGNDTVTTPPVAQHARQQLLQQASLVSDVKPGEFNFVASLQKRRKGQWIHFCAGTMISPKHLLTASNCWLDNEVRGDITSMTVVLKRNIDEGSEFLTRFHIRHWQNKFELKNFDSKLVDDLALVELFLDITDFPGVTFHPYISSFLPSPPCFALGWGSLFANRQRKSVLQKAEVKLLDPLQCISKWGHTEVGSQKDCAEDPPGGFDYYDLGGPIFCLNKRINLLGLYGIVATKRDPSTPEDNWGLFVNLGRASPQRFIINNLLIRATAAYTVMPYFPLVFIISLNLCLQL